MIPKTMQKGFVTIVEQACEIVPGFRNSYQKFHQKAIIEQNSSSFVENYGRSAANIALHFGVSPEKLSVEEINSYLYYKCIFWIESP
jgi:integrase/recombinase XerD